jgi:acyl dehydratase
MMRIWYDRTGGAMDPLYFDDLEVGREWLSAPRAVTAADVRAFADLTGDSNPLHLDPTFARATPFRRPIAHGLLGLALAGGLTTAAPAVRVQAFLGLRDWEFRHPVYVGDVVRVRQRVAGKEARPGGRRGVVVWGVEVSNQDGRVVQRGTTRLLVEARRSGAVPRGVVGKAA